MPETSFIESAPDNLNQHEEVVGEVMHESSVVIHEPSIVIHDETADCLSTKTELACENINTDSNEVGKTVYDEVDTNKNQEALSLATEVRSASNGSDSVDFEFPEIQELLKSPESSESKQSNTSLNSQTDEITDLTPKTKKSASSKKSSTRTRKKAKAEFAPLNLLFNPEDYE